MTEHDLKTLPEYWYAVASGVKTFEIREARDRDFNVGDTLLLRLTETDGSPTQNVIRRRVTYIFQGGKYGLAEGYVIMGLGEVP